MPCSAAGAGLTVHGVEFASRFLNVPIEILPVCRRFRSWRFKPLLLAVATLGPGAVAEPVRQLADDGTDSRPSLVFEPAGAQPDLAGPELVWVGQPSTRFMLDARVAEDRREVVRQPLVDRGPTWMQNAAIVNLGDFPTLHNTAANADREINTLVWMIESDHRRLATSHLGNRVDSAPAELSWIRLLMPAQWLSTLRAYRDWVLVGGVAVAALVWGMALYARRPGSLPSRDAASQHGALNSTQHSTLSGLSSAHAPLTAAMSGPVPLLRRQHRRRRRHGI